MKVYYNIEVQMAGMCKMTDDVLSKVTHTIGVDYTDYDEIETYSAVMFFGSEVKPSEMRERVRECLRKAENIHYIDVVYRWENEINADRYVIWGDGHEQDYTGHMVYEEDRV